MNRIRQISPQTQVVMQTAYSDIELAVKSIKEGAVDFLPKPWDKEKLVCYSDQCVSAGKGAKRKQGTEVET